MGQLADAMQDDGRLMVTAVYDATFDAFRNGVGTYTDLINDETSRKPGTI